MRQIIFQVVALQNDTSGGGGFNIDSRENRCGIQSLGVVLIVQPALFYTFLVLPKICHIPIGDIDKSCNICRQAVLASKISRTLPTKREILPMKSFSSGV